ncbi:ATP-binding protein [Pseudodesulfovibrio tunisiensis]|uniref:ATP-binding protein n=1 Tax=Pseudodesulfovibrio tunisiensis TaxID=463192 RepID=UPI001FB1AEC8|nr:ATP-binding protein [Pseudodesulfovibrio tunisiensis]
MPSDAHHSSKITARAVPGILPEFRSHVLQCASRAGASAAQLTRIELAFEEALMNVCTHAYPEKTGTVSVDCFTKREKTGAPLFCVRLTDHGEPFNPLEHTPRPTPADMNSRTPGGMGIVLLQRMVDQADYFRTDTANCMILCFSLSVR